MINPKNCGNCENCVTGGNPRRFRCIAVPSDPSVFWSGLPEGNSCVAYYTPKKTEPDKLNKKKSEEL